MREVDSGIENLLSKIDIRKMFTNLTFLRFGSKTMF